MFLIKWFLHLFKVSTVYCCVVVIIVVVVVVVVVSGHHCEDPTGHLPAPGTFLPSLSTWEKSGRAKPVL